MGRVTRSSTAKASNKNEEKTVTVKKETIAKKPAAKTDAPKEKSTPAVKVVETKKTADDKPTVSIEACKQ